MSLSRPALAAMCGLLVTGCGMPRDPHHTLQRVEGKTLRVGISPNQPWTATELTAIQAVAAGLHARPIYSQGAESALIRKLEQGELDLVAGGLERSTPWKKKVGLTRPYPGSEGKHVLAARAGENGFLVKVDQLLDAQEGP